MSDKLNRVILWCTPRTVSTALLKCLSFVDGIQVVNEPYQCAYHAGPERKLQNPDLNNPMETRLFEIADYSGGDDTGQGFESQVCTYGWLRELLEAPYPDKKILFCKDMAMYVDGKYDMLPRGFKHSFLIRHPAKVFLSWKTSMHKIFHGVDPALMDDLRKLPDCLFPVGYGFKELYDLMEYVEKDLDQKAIILDTDDLLADSAGILPAYCQEVGIPYTPDLLKWEAGTSSMPESWISSKVMVNACKIGTFYDEAFMSTEFRPPGSPPAFESLPSDVQACVEASMGYYEKLREKRIKPISHD